MKLSKILQRTLVLILAALITLPSTVLAAEPSESKAEKNNNLLLDSYYDDYGDDYYWEDDDYYDDYYGDLDLDSEIYDVYYGDSKISGYTESGIRVTLYLKSKTYTVYSDSYGNFTFKNIPMYKIGTSFSITFNNGYEAVTQSGKIKNNKPYMENYYLYYYQNKIHGCVKHVHKGDVIKIKIGKKTYKKKIKKNAKKVKYSFKIKKKPYGTKIKLSIYNKYNQKLTSYNDVVYYSKKLKKGMTQKQAKCVPGWTHPDYKEHYSFGVYWWYDDDGDGYADDSYLFFNSNGRLSDWYYYN